MLDYIRSHFEGWDVFSSRVSKPRDEGDVWRVRVTLRRGNERMILRGQGPDGKAAWADLMENDLERGLYQMGLPGLSEAPPERVYRREGIDLPKKR